MERREREERSNGGMTRTHALLVAAGLLIASALVLRSPAAESERVEQPPPAPPSSAAPPVKPGPAGPLDGVYFLGGGRTLTLTHGRFVLENHGASPEETVRGVAQVKGTSLELRSGLLVAQCDWSIAGDHLLVSATAACHLLSRERFPRREVPSGPIDLGEVGLQPFRGTTGVGFWLDEREQGIQMSAAPEPVRDPVSFGQHTGRLLHWDPDEFGLVSEFQPMDHFMNHMDTDFRVFWVMTGPDTAEWVSTGGCNLFEDQFVRRSFRRVSSAEYEAVLRRKFPPSTPSAPPAE